MDVSFWQYILAILGGALAGVINTLAGNGSVITLSILTEVIGLEAGIANGTNRVGIFFQTAGTTAGFAKNKMVDFSRAKLPIITTILGSIAGVILVLNTSNENFLFVFKYMMVVMLVIILIKPERWLKKDNLIVNTSKWISIPLFFIIGFYGGFIQMGAGVFILAVLVLISKYNIMQANVLKSVIVMIYIGIVMVIFAWKGLIDWKIGGILALGQTLGGYLSAAYLSKVANIDKWSYWLLIVIVVLAIFSQFEVFNLIFKDI